MTDSQSAPVRGVEPRRLAAALGLIVVVAAVIGLIVLFGGSRGPIKDVSFPGDSTATVLYAGRFPADDEPALLNPLGIDIHEDTLYVAESDGGRVSLFSLDGSAMGSIVIPVAQGAPSAYPADVAVLGEDRLVVVDNAGLRVLIMRTDPTDDEPVVGIIGEDDETSRPRQPTAVAVGSDEIFVADAEDQTIKVYGPDGVFIRVLAGDLEQPLTFVGGMAVTDGELVVTDSNAGRVIVLDRNTGVLKRTLPDTRVLPRGVCLGAEGEILTVDTFERAVFRTTTEGVQIDVIEGDVDGEAALSSPRDVAWSQTVTMAFVTDASSGHVVAYLMRTSAN